MRGVAPASSPGLVAAAWGRGRAGGCRSPAAGGLSRGAAAARADATEVKGVLGDIHVQLCANKLDDLEEMGKVLET